MKITRDVAIKILMYLHKNPKFYFPFSVMCKEYSPEDDDFVEIEPHEWEVIKGDESYQTFELRENLQHLYKWTTELLAKWFIEKIIWKDLYKEVYSLAKYYKTLYKKDLWYDSNKIEEYWENEFFWWKKEAFEDVLNLMKKYKF